MITRALALASATALATAALTAGANPAFADTCNYTVDGPLDGTVVCAVPGSVGVTWRTVNLSVGSICVDTTCTPAVSQPVDVPSTVNDPADLYGTLCVQPTPKTVQVCRSFSDDKILGSIAIGAL